MNVEQARFNMVEQQIRPWDVLDQGVLDLLFELPREQFVPEQHRELAFADLELPLGHGELMLTPKLEARMLQELAIRPTDRILEVGTGSGYLTALLARRGAHVVSVEILPELKAYADKNLKQHHILNVSLELGDASRGWPQHGPYDAIVLTGSTPVLPDAFQASLAPGGRLVVVVGDPPVMTARLVTRVSETSFSSVGLFETCIPALRNAAQPERFVF